MLLFFPSDPSRKNRIYSRCDNWSKKIWRPTTKHNTLRTTAVCWYRGKKKKGYCKVAHSYASCSVRLKNFFLNQIFVGKIPRDLFEDELVPLFEKAGAIWDLRLMMDPLTGLNRGYAFVTFCTKEAAQEAVKLVS